MPDQISQLPKYNDKKHDNQHTRHSASSFIMPSVNMLSVTVPDVANLSVTLTNGVMLSVGAPMHYLSFVFMCFLHLSLISTLEIRMC